MFASKRKLEEDKWQMLVMMYLVKGGVVLDVTLQLLLLYPAPLEPTDKKR